MNTAKSNVAVRSAGEGEQTAVIDVITLAFGGDPMARWALPDPSSYLAVMPEVARAFGGNGFGRGTVHVLADGAGAAMWLPPGVEPDSERLMTLMEAHSPAHVVPDMLQVFERMDAFHPREPHWYLPLIGVDPAQQGRGLGGVLLEHALAQCDRDAVPAYLESSNPRNVPLYRRHGFEIIGEIQAGSSPALVPMLRHPR